MTTRRNQKCLVLFILTFPVVLSFILWLSSITFAAGSVTLDGSLNPSHQGTVGSGVVNGISTTYLISEDLGKRAGDNLFHSFGTFNIGTGESATFTGPSGINNIISRVTGGSPSSIDGLIRSTIDGANLFLLNPSGVMFGPNASLDVSGSFHVGTADYLKFSDGSVFYAKPAANSVLSVSAPEAFGFLSSNPAAISLDRSVLQVPSGKTLSIIGGDINAQNDPSLNTYYDYDNFIPGPTYYVLSAPGGRINLISVASPGEVNLVAQDLGLGSFTKLGNITFSNGANLNIADIDPMSQPAGTIIIRGGQMFFKDAGIEASGNPGGIIDIKGESLHLDNFSINILNTGETNHPGTACKLDISQDILMTNNSWIDSTTIGPGRAGDINIRGNNIKLGDDTPGTGPGADYGLYGYISSRCDASTGNGGDISITAGNLLLQNGFFITAATFDQGQAGNISVNADTLKLLDRGLIASNALGIGKGGIVDIKARDVLISAANEAAVINLFNLTGIGSQTDVESDGGKIVLTVDNLQILDGGKISTILFSTGHGADVEINAKNIIISGYVVRSDAPFYALSAIDGRVYGSAATGTGGNITVNSESLKLSNGGVIRTGLYPDENGGPSGNAGNITIKAGEIDITDRGQIYADSFRGTGNSGDISISANNLHITGAAGTPRPEPLDFDFTGLSTTTNSGRGGTIEVSLTGNLILAAQGAISADTQGTGAGGAVNIAAQKILLTDQSTISSSSSGTGNAGNIDITVTTSSLKMRNSSITTEALQADGGDIKITAPSMLDLVDSKITASVGGGPETTGGNISIDPEFIVLKNSRIIANAYEGKGGNIKIVADTFLSDPKSIVDASSALGISGTVNINAPINNISGILNPLSTDFISATNLLRERCIARIRGGKYSSFIVGGRDALPIEPGNLLPSLPY
jgi:filamentous hemagglutinin family protein